MEFGDNLSVLQGMDDFEIIESQIADPRIMFALLTKLYNDLTRIIVQEYIANARDAHREIGNVDRPILITLPTRFTNELIIRDFGPGISHDRVAKVFAHLGASTKRDDNNQTGGFGIGAKSAFCYVDSFNIDTFIDGVKRSYTFLKAGEDGKPKIVVLGQEETEEENGTAIYINIKASDIDKICANVYKLTQFWDVRPDIVNPDTYYGQKYRNFDVIVEGTNYKFFSNCPDTYVVVDGIPYGFHYDACFSGQEDYDKYYEIFKTRCFNFFFNTGDVSISPNREGLSYDNETVVKVRSVVDAAIDEIKVNTQTSIDSIDNIFDAKDAIDRFKNLSMFTKGLTWKGNDLESFKLNEKFYRVTSYRSYRKKLRSHQVWDLTISRNYNYIFCDEEEVHYSRIRTIDATHSNYYIIELVDYKPNTLQTEAEFEAERDAYDASINIRSFGFKLISSYEKYVPVRKTKVTGNIYVFYRSCKSSRNTWTLQDVDYDEVEGYYVEWIRGEAKGYSNYALEKIKYKYGIHIYGVPSRFINKLDNSETLESLDSFINEKVDEYKEFIDKNKHIIYAKDVINMNRSEIHTLNKCGDEVVELLKQDPEFLEYFNKLDIVKNFSKMTYDENMMKEFRGFCDIVGGRIDRSICVPELDLEDITPSIFKKYPLLTCVDNYSYDSDMKDHAKMYVSMIMGNYKPHNPQGLGVLDVTELE